MRRYGLELLAETARFWVSYARHDPADDRYDIRGVVGPDEYHTRYPGAGKPGLDNNAYTNVMASVALRNAAEAALAEDDTASRLGVTAEEAETWWHVAARIRLCFLEDNILAQFQGFSALKPLSGADYARRHPNGRIDLELQARGDDINAYRASKQADMLTLLYLFQPHQLAAHIGFMGYEMDVEALRRTAEFYLGYVTHESSLSHIVCAGALAMFDLDQSWAFFRNSLFIDWLADHAASAEEGLHLGAMAGSLTILQRHYLGLHAEDEAIYLAPCIPPELGPVRMALRHRGQCFSIAWTGSCIRLAAAPENSAPLRLVHANIRHELHPGREMTFPPSIRP